MRMLMCLDWGFSSPNEKGGMKIERISLQPPIDIVVNGLFIFNA